MANALPSAQEIASAREVLQSSRDQLLAFCARLQPEDWRRSDGDGRWTIAQILDHLVIVEERSAAIFEALVNGTPDPDWEAKTAHKDSLLERAAVVEVRVQAPPAIHPTAAPDGPALLGKFQTVRARNLALANRPGLPLKQYVRAHPVFGDVNALQNLRLLGYHTQRHLSQMRGCL
jgi:hypothetical protein